MKEFQPPPKTIKRSPGHYREWFDAIRANDPTLAMSNFDYAGPLTETLLLGCLVTRLPPNTKITWNRAAMRTDNDVANAHIEEVYRNGWVL